MPHLGHILAHDLSEEMGVAHHNDTLSRRENDFPHKFVQSLVDFAFVLAKLRPPRMVHLNENRLKREDRSTSIYANILRT